MDSHKRILGILYIISGSLQIMAWLILMAFFGVLLPFILERADPDDIEVIRWIFPFVRILIAVFVLLFAIPSIIGGVGLLNKKKWALTLVLILGCFKLFSFPIGTALGIYTIWVYVESTRNPVPAA